MYNKHLVGKWEKRQFLVLTQMAPHNTEAALLALTDIALFTQLWCPDPSQKIRARVNACAREGEKGLVNNYASPRAKAGMLEQVLVCKH